MRKDNQQYSFQEVLSKLMKYCSYQDRSALEIKQKAIKLGAKSTDIENLIALLEEEKFYDEQRFVKNYVRGKLNVKQWGRYKIKEGLIAKGVNRRCIEQIMGEISEKRFFENLMRLIEKRGISKNPGKTEMAKHYRYFLTKGYAADTIRAAFENKGWM